MKRYLRTDVGTGILGQFWSDGGWVGLWPLVEFVHFDFPDLWDYMGGETKKLIRRDVQADAFDMRWSDGTAALPEKGDAAQLYATLWQIVGDFLDEMAVEMGRVPKGSLQVAAFRGWAGRGMQEWIAYRLFEQVNGRVYVVAPDLGHALANTRLKGLDSSQLRLPGRVIYVDLRMCDESDRSQLKKMGMEDFAGCYVIESEIVGGRRAWQILTIKDGGISGYFPEAVSYFTIHWKEGASIEESLSLSLRKDIGYAANNVRASDEFKEMVREAGVEIESDFLQERGIGFKALFSLLTNIVLYITHPDADAILMDASEEYDRLRERMLKAKGARREKLKARMRGMGQRPRVVLGSNFQLIIDRKGEADKGRKTETGRSWELSVRCSVQGHWRNQACGEGRRDRKLIWIAPHFRGPDVAGLTEHRKVIVK